MTEHIEIDPMKLSRGHPLRETAEAETKIRMMETIEAQKMGADTRRMDIVEGENEKIFSLHHEFMNPSITRILSPDFAESLNKILALSNYKDNEVSELEYHFDILTIKELNYSKKRAYTPAKSRVMETMRMYFYSQIRRGRGGWEREMEVTERKTLRAEVPMPMKKKSGGMLSKIFGGR